MSVTHDTAMRNAQADAVKTRVDTGSGTAKLRLRDSAVTIVDFDFPVPSFPPASAGVITLNGVPIAAVAVATGEVDNARIIDRNGGAPIVCSVTGVGGGGDIEVSNVNIAIGQDCALENLSYAAAP